MKQAEFDKFAEEYNRHMSKSISLSGEGIEFFTDYKIKDLADVAKVHSKFEAPKILDFGIGIGNSIPYFKKYFAGVEVTGVDVSKQSLEIAEKRFPGQAKLLSFNGQILPFEDNTFDLAIATCVFHHIEHDYQLGLLREILRSLKPGGIFMLYEHNPLNPLTRKIVRECIFDESAVLISSFQAKAILEKAGFSKIRTDFRLFFPKKLGFLRRLEKYLTWLPLGAQYFVLGVK